MNKEELREKITNELINMESEEVKSVLLMIILNMCDNIKQEHIEILYTKYIDLFNSIKQVYLNKK